MLRECQNFAHNYYYNKGGNEKHKRESLGYRGCRSVNNGRRHKHALIFCLVAIVYVSTEALAAMLFFYSLQW